MRRRFEEQEHPYTQEQERRNIRIRHILTNGYYPGKKVSELKKLGVDVEARYLEPQDDFYNRFIRDSTDEYIGHI